MQDTSTALTAEFEVPFREIPFGRIRPFSSLVEIDFGASTHTGKVRSNNEDAYIVYKIGRYWNQIKTSLSRNELPDSYEDSGYAMAVADGMGGAVAGEIASNLAIQACINLVLQSPRWALKLDNVQTREEEIQAAKLRAEEYFRKIDAVLLKQAEIYPGLKGMGSTLTGAYSCGDDLFIVHIGDSRAYLFRDRELILLTEDHTLSQAMVQMGSLTPQQAASHRFRHTLTRCLGGAQREIQVDIDHDKLQNGDRILLCTDGLNDMVEDNDIARVLTETKGSQAACDLLLDRALANGGKDNITVVLAEYSIPSR